MDVTETQAMAEAGADGKAGGEATLPVRLLIADDHGLMRWALGAMISDEPDLEVVGEAKDGREALYLSRRLRPDVVLMDVQMPDIDGIEATKEIKAERPEVVVLVVTAFEDPDYLLEAIRAGAAGYVLKYADRDELLGAVRGVSSGESPLNEDLAMTLLQRLAGETSGRPERRPEKRREAQPPGPLTARELDVLALLAAGKTNRTIAHELHLSLSTVKGHLERIISKLEVSDRTQAAVRAVELGLLSERGEG